jgi:hypothetical protein
MFSHLHRLEDDQPLEGPWKRKSTVENFSFLLDDEDLLECFLNLPDENHLPFALDLGRIAQGQAALDMELTQRQMQHPIQYPEQQFDNVQILSFKPNPTARWKICIPTQQLENIVNWFHLSLNHCGLHWLMSTMSLHLYHPRLRAVAECITKHCNACQKEKLPGPQYGQLPPRESNLAKKWL